MSLARRLTLVAVAVGVGLAAHVWLQRHLAAGESGAFPELRVPLAALPEQLGSGETDPPWLGREHPAREAVAKQVPFLDEMLYRAYVTKDEQNAAVVYLAHSRSGEDRKHHPEICMREAAGAPEDLSARRLVSLGEEDRQAQRFRFQVGTGRYLYLYYWHYSFPPASAGAESPLQALHRRALTAPPSVTVQVSTHAGGEDLEAVELSFLPALDRALRDRLLPPGCRVGHTRIPITMIRR